MGEGAGRDDSRRPGGIRRAFGAILMILGIVAAAAAGLIVYSNYAEADAAFAAAQADALSLSAEIEADAARTRDLGFVPDYVLDPTRDMPVVEVDGRRYVGIIEFPDLDRALPVMESWSYDSLKIAPCRYNGTAYRAGFAICAHNYARHFGQIKDLQTGNEIWFTDAAGNRFGYVVRMIETLQPTDTAKVVYSDWALTLFTCTLGGQARVTVRCDRLEGATGFEF